MLSKIFIKEVEGIHNDTQSGASRIALDCLEVLRNEVLRLSPNMEIPHLKTAIQLLLDTHPMSTIENALFPIYLRLVQQIKSERLKKGDHKATIEMIFNTQKDQMKKAEKNTINTLVELLKEKNSILTFSYSSTVVKALLRLAKEGFRDKELFVLESRPLQEGERTSFSLATAGFRKTNLGIDLSINEFADLAEIAILGADMVNLNGHILNKIGSATIAELFNNRSKEVWIAASLNKICLRGILDHTHDWHPLVSHRNPKEVSSLSSPNLLVWNKYFEVIKPEYISSLIMDRFVFNSPIEKELKNFILTNKSLSSQIDALSVLWNEADFSTF